MSEGEQAESREDFYFLMMDYLDVLKEQIGDSDEDVDENENV